MGNDDILNTRIQKDLIKKDWNVPRDYQKRKRMKKLLGIIMKYSDFDMGVSHAQLAESFGRDRKTIRKDLNSLMEMDLVTRDLGKHGKYFPTIKRHRGISISADILAESFKERVLDILNEPFVLNSQHFKRKIAYAEFELEDALFSFSNIIGGWITFVLIQSMNPSTLTDNVKGNIEKKLSVAAFIEDAISLIQPYLLIFFNNYINIFLKTLEKKVEGMEGGFNMSNVLQVFSIDPVFKGQLFDEESISELNKAFSKVYPNLSHELEKTRLELPTLISHKIDERKRFAEIIKRQENCKLHQYVPLPEDSDEDYSIIRCKKCGKTKKKKK